MLQNTPATLAGVLAVFASARNFAIGAVTPCSAGRPEAVAPAGDAAAAAATAWSALVKPSDSLASSACRSASVPCRAPAAKRVWKV